MKNDGFTVLVSGGSRCQLSEHVHCVAIPFKMTEPVEQRICIKFCIKLEHSSTNYLDDSEVRTYGQLVIGSFLMTMRLPMHHVLRSFLVKHQITPTAPDLVP